MNTPTIPKDFKMENLGINRDIIIHNMEEAIAVYQSGEIFAKIGDERRGSALDWVKRNKPDQFESFIFSMKIKKDMANKLIAYSKLVEVAKEEGSDYPKSAATTAKIPGSVTTKIDTYNKIKEEVGHEPTRKDISDYKKKLSSKYSDISDIRNSNLKKNLRNEKEEVIDVEPEPTVDLVAENKALKAEIEKLKSKLKKETALKEKYYKELKGYKEDIEKLASDMNDALRPLVTILEAMKIEEDEKILREKASKAQFRNSTERVNQALRFFGLSSDFKKDELKSAYRNLAKQLHPDKGGNADEFFELTYLKETLDDFYKFRKVI